MDLIIDELLKTGRNGIKALIEHIKHETDFFTAPCSTQYHLSCEGGLSEHSYNVYAFGLSVTNSCIYEQIKRDEWTIVSLLHDIEKATYRGKSNYIPNILKSGKRSTEKPYVSNPERLCIPHEIVSLQTLSRFIDLTQEEEFAILYHNGLYVPSGRDIQGKERPLQQLLHFADMWCSRFIEKEGKRA